MPETPTVHLGQFTDEHAEAIAEALEDAGIVWWAKSSGRLARLLFAGDWGVRLFVERERHEEAVAIAERIAPGGVS